MTARRFLSETVRSARGAVVSSALVLVVLALTCFGALSIAGKNAAYEAQVRAQFEGTGARQITYHSGGNNQCINELTVASIAKLPAVTAVLALGGVTDVTNGAIPGTPPVALQPVRGDLPAATTLTQGRWPAPGEVILGEAAVSKLRFAMASGYVETSAGQQYAVVGAYRANDAHTNLNDMAITPAAGGEKLTTLHVDVRELADVGVVQASAYSIMNPSEPQNLMIHSGRVAAQTALEASLLASAAGRSTFLLILGVGGLFVSIVVLSDVLIQRRDLGRRRALGCSRGLLVALVTARNTLAGSIGAALGTGVALIYAWYSFTLPPLDFALAVMVLCILVCLVANLPPAIFAARRDPVSVLRTP